MGKIIWLLPFGGFFVGYLLANIFFGVDKVVVPNIVGLPISQALKCSCDQRLHLRVVAEKIDQQASAGTVLSQRPEKGQLVKQHQTIFITLSRQPSECMMPAVVGKDGAQVSADLRVSHGAPICISVPSSAPKGTIIAQYPVAGDAIKDVIYLYTAAQEDEHVLMPDFCGRRLTEVTEFLSRYNIQPLVMGGESCSAGTCVVTKQRPCAGTVIDLAHPPTTQVLVQAVVGQPLHEKSDLELQKVLIEADIAQ